MRHPKEKDILKIFAKNESLSEGEAEDVLNSTLDRGYLEYTRPPVDSRDVHLKVTPTEGRDLIYKLGFIKLGKWNTILKHFSVLTTIALTILTAAILGNIVDIIKFIAAHT